MNFKLDTLCEVQDSISSFFWIQGPPYVIWLEMGNRMIDTDLEFLKLTHYDKFQAPHLPSFDGRVLHRFCIQQNIIKLPLSSWWMWVEMGNRMIDKDFVFQTSHAMWSSRPHIFLLLTSGSSRCLVFERLFSNHHYLNDQYV